ncbi:DUF2304 domain-containing protein [Flexivirga sp.]|uniref:DUF2304 domain-containing protein n=1 Tax=Flexivirga sp. TaxID=1962927 RepID=UPI003F7DAADB
MIFQTFAIVVALATIAGMYALIRQGWLKEKYTLIWVLAALVTLLVGVFPPILDWFADIVGVQQGPNLLFLAAGVAMMLICVQLSVEASTQSYKSRTLAEEVAILRLEVERQRRDLDALTALTVEHRLERGLHQ